MVVALRISINVTSLTKVFENIGRSRLFSRTADRSVTANSLVLNILYTYFVLEPLVPIKESILNYFLVC